MKLFERLGQMLATPGVTRWRVVSLALLLPVALGMLLGDWLQGPEAGYAPAVLALGGLFFLSQAVLLVWEGQARRKLSVLLTFLIFGVGLVYLALNPAP